MAIFIHDVFNGLVMPDSDNFLAITAMPKFESYIEEQTNNTCTISVLPPELLIEVFRHCVANEPLAPLSLRRVSWTWRGLVDSCPRLWQTIALNDIDGLLFSEEQAELWTERSKPLNYDIELTVDDPDYILPLLSPLLPTIDRWRSFRLGGKREEEVKSSEVTLTPDSLTHLHLCLHDYELDDIDDEDSKISLSPISPSENANFALNLWVSRIPTTTFLPPLRFVHLTIAEGGSIGLHTQPKYILDFLQACPELESFFLSGWPHDGPIIQPLPVVFLPNLVTLHLKSTCFARAFLSSLDTPRLQNLYLSHLNVDFQLYGDHQEEGDSEDEAHDYSQSPWSDQATGMGLRRLLKRCHPPIRVLEMDFCDMRTKDFSYVFDRLSYLEDFHIVASDMSDKVINLLRPVETVGEGAVKLRLPRLRRLRLTNCQRLSGRAIVDSIAARVKWTDRACPDDSLVDVVIAGCEGFSVMDRHTLFMEIGNRLRP
ncbi:hypothetical protein CVT26_000809 [Gymnopilus dilepis]|uniref:F-box domain-containing protein n=1 Tax=Gymnopilus dilepis TaxID=231916 RepID=A0A409VHZ0_9AGAR|nr:hypothetical protein CVT26_000809 [Gymnopilus dilepis]